MKFNNNAKCFSVLGSLSVYIKEGILKSPTEPRKANQSISRSKMRHSSKVAPIVWDNW